MQVTESWVNLYGSLHPAMIILVLSAFAGALHIVAPDHWVPVSVLSWQRRWTKSRTIVISLLLLALHVLAGAGIYLLLHRFCLAVPSVSRWSVDRIFVMSLVLVAFCAAIRGSRFNRIGEVFRAGPHGAWGTLAVLSLLGPCEWMLPILIKAAQIGMGFFLPFAFFLGGTLLTGAVCVSLGQRIWNRPMLFSRSMEWIRRAKPIFPVASFVVAVLCVAFFAR
jgi:hypothetical protein